MRYDSNGSHRTSCISHQPKGKDVLIKWVKKDNFLLFRRFWHLYIGDIVAMVVICDSDHTKFGCSKSLLLWVNKFDYLSKK